MEKPSTCLSCRCLLQCLLQTLFQMHYCFRHFICSNDKERDEKTQVHRFMLELLSPYLYHEFLVNICLFHEYNFGHIQCAQYSNLIPSQSVTSTNKS